MSKTVVYFVVDDVFNIFTFGNADIIEDMKCLFRSRDTSKLKSPTIISLSENW